MNSLHTFVIPAKAGIQPVKLAFIYILWIPACTGMTVQILCLCIHNNKTFVSSVSSVANFLILIYPTTITASISTCASLGSDATPMAARAG